MATQTSALLLVKIVTDAKGAVAGMDQATGRVGKFQAGLKKAAIPAAIAGAAILKFGSMSVDAASRTEQAMGAVESVFGRNAGTVEKWASNAASQLGLAKSEYGELASVIGAQLKNAGLPMDEVTKKTGDLVKLGADLSATYGGTTKDAVEALGAALRGEADPAERYGLALNQNRINAELAKKGMEGLTGEALAQAKAQTMVEMATKQAGGAVGQFARESDTASGSAQIAAAQWENAQSALGEALLPAVTAVTNKLAGMAQWMGDNTKTTQIVVGVIGALAAAVFVLIGALKVYEAVSKAVALVSKATWLSNPIFIVIAAVIALVAAFVILYKKSSTFRNFVNGMWAGIKRAASATAKVIKAVWSALWSVLKRYVAVYKAYFVLVFNIIKGVVKAVVAVFKGDWRGALSAVRGILSAFGSFFRSLWSNLGGPIRALGGLVRSIMSSAISAVRGFISRAASSAKTVASNMVSAVSGAASDMFSAGVDLVLGLIDGIKSMAGAAVDAAKDVVGGAIKGAKALLGIGSPSKVFKAIGKDTVKGFVIGVTGSESAAARAFDSLANIIKKSLKGKAERNELAYLKRSEKRWDKWLKRREALANRVARADQKVRDLTAEMADYARDVADSAQGFASAVAATFDEGVTPDANAFIQNMRERVEAVRMFTNNVKALAARGLNKTTLRELVDAGVEGGSAFAEAMLQGGSGAVAAVNDMQRQLATTAKELGGFAGDQFYGAGVASAKAIAKGLHSQQSALNKTMQRIARSMANALVKEINAALKRANAGGGGKGGGGRRSVNAKSYAAPSMLGRGATGAAATSGGGGGVTIQVNGALDPEAVARQIRRILDGHDRRVGLKTA